MIAARPRRPARPPSTRYAIQHADGELSPGPLDWVIRQHVAAARDHRATVVMYRTEMCSDWRELDAAAVGRAIERLANGDG